MALYSVAGLDNQQIDLPVPLIVHLLPFSPQHRPGTPRQPPGYWVQHETGNPNAGADAAMHDRYLQGLDASTYVSWHFTVDDHVIYQHVPIDEVTWQAADGAGPGNMSGVSSELCINAGIDTVKARHNAEALAGGIMKALGLPLDRCKRHYDFNAADPDRHHCPDQMMNEGYWPTFVGNVGHILSPAPAPAPAYKHPVGLPFDLNTATGWQVLNGLDVFMVEFEDECIKDAIPRAFASGTAPQSAAKVKVKDVVPFKAIFKDGKGVGWRLMTDGSRIVSASFHTNLTAKKR
jgi:hypothetical protein